MAKLAFGNKNTKYLHIANTNGLSFKPIIFESTGRVHEDTAKFFQKLAGHAGEVKGMDKSIVYGYMMNKLSVVLQYYTAQSIITRTNTVNGRVGRATAGYAMSDTFVFNHDRFNARIRRDRR